LQFSSRSRSFIRKVEQDEESAENLFPLLLFNSSNHLLNFLDLTSQRRNKEKEKKKKKKSLNQTAHTKGSKKQKVRSDC